MSDSRSQNPAPAVKSCMDSELKVMNKQPCDQSQKNHDESHNHIKVVVAFSSLCIHRLVGHIRHHEVVFGQNTAEMKPKSLPDLFKTSRAR